MNQQNYGVKQCISACENIAKNKEAVQRAMELFEKYCLPEISGHKDLVLQSFVELKDGRLQVMLLARCTNLIFEINIEATEAEFKAGKLPNGDGVFKLIW